jgi:hypothetical protein
MPSVTVQKLLSSLIEQEKVNPKIDPFLLFLLKSTYFQVTCKSDFVDFIFLLMSLKAQN